MFSKDIYIQRRDTLKRLVGEGVIILMGNNESPCNYPNNGYYPFRQDSSFLYYFGQQRDGLVGVIDVDNNRETLIGNDIDIEDIVWYGSVDSVADMASQVGVANSAPMSALKDICDQARAQGRTVHFLPPYRHDTMIQLMDLLGIHPSKQREAASHALRMAVITMRSAKTPLEVSPPSSRNMAKSCMAIRRWPCSRPDAWRSATAVPRPWSTTAATTRAPCL